MTDKEKAEGYYEDNDYYSSLSEIEDYDEIFGLVENIVKKAYLDGLKEGRQKWHNLRKDPNDLPKENKEYLVAFKNFLNQEEIVTDVFNWEICKFVDEDYTDIPWLEYKDVLVAWCEIPRFEE